MPYSTRHERGRSQRTLDGRYPVAGKAAWQEALGEFPHQRLAGCGPGRACVGSGRFKAWPVTRSKRAMYLLLNSMMVSSGIGGIGSV